MSFVYRNRLIFTKIVFDSWPCILYLIFTYTMHTWKYLDKLIRYTRIKTEYTRRSFPLHKTHQSRSVRKPVVVNRLKINIRIKISFVLREFRLHKSHQWHFQKNMKRLKYEVEYHTDRKFKKVSSNTTTVIFSCGLKSLVLVRRLNKNEERLFH